ncbi:hypothetical protein AB4Y67_14445 [Arthrobacter sp. YAF17]|uniref:hypothetical protein n=1 Tax=Arthrobacter sp. YAF17 TaxID=3233077 RepID=UPI003F8EECFA
MNPSGDGPAGGDPVGDGPSGDRQSGPSRATRLARVAVPLVALALILAGIVLLSVPVQQESFGWFAYAPLSQQTFVPQGMLIMDREKWAGVVLTGAGLLALTFWSGFRAGRRSRRRGDGHPSAT